MNQDTKQALFDICTKYNDVFIIDMYNYIFKFYYANHGLSVIKNGEEIPTGQFFGITRQVLFLKDKFPNCAIIFAIDGHDEERKVLNPDYKAGRVHEIRPSDYVNDILRFCSIVDGVYSIYDEHYEADDVIGSVVGVLRDLCDKNSINKTAYILSSDRDMYQLITNGGFCKVMSIKKFGYGVNWREDTEFIDESKVREAFNDVSPKDLLKFRAITGDSSDNIKGYYRYRKANASIIANNFDYIQEEHKLRLKPGVDMRESWKKFLNVILENFTVFETNYAIMRLKRFDFEVVSNYKDIPKEDVKRIVEDLNFYELNTYINSVGYYSPYRDIIAECSNTDLSRDNDVVGSISMDLESLLNTD